MLYPLTVVVVLAAVVLMVLSGWYAVRGRLVDDPLLFVGVALELGVLVQLVVALAHLGRVTGGSSEQATFAAYAITLPFVAPVSIFLALKEKTRWAMVVVVVGAFGVAVMTARLQQIWNLGG